MEAVAVDVATQRPAAALILESTFSSARDMAKVLLPIVPSSFVRVKLDCLAKIGKVRAMVEAKNITTEKPTWVWLKAQVKRATEKDKRAVYDWLRRHYGD